MACDLRTHTDSFVSLPQEIGRLRRRVNDDVRMVLAEIIRVQKALQAGASIGFKESFESF